jgi:hypothetical protein
MGHLGLFKAVATLTMLVLLAAGTCLAVEIEDQLSNYVGDNAEGYLGPLADAIGTDLNSGLYQSAYIPKNGRYFSVEFRVMSVLFSDDDRTFDATTPEGFTPEMTVEAPTIVGDGEAVEAVGEAGATNLFPGGFDLSSFSLAAPQLRFGSLYGTEALLRYFAIDVGDNEFGSLSLFGFGLRHSISQYFAEDFPVHLAGGFFWQTFKLGENNAGGDLVSASALTFGVQASKRFGQGIAFVEPYAGLALDQFSVEASYEDEGEELVDLDFGSDTTARLTLGIAGRFAILNYHMEYSLASQSSVSFGLAFGMF